MCDPVFTCARRRSVRLLAYPQLLRNLPHRLSARHGDNPPSNSPSPLRHNFPDAGKDCFHPRDVLGRKFVSLQQVVVGRLRQMQHWGALFTCQRLGPGNRRFLPGRLGVDAGKEVIRPVFGWPPPCRTSASREEAARLPAAYCSPLAWPEPPWRTLRLCYCRVSEVPGCTMLCKLPREHFYAVLVPCLELANPHPEDRILTATTFQKISHSVPDLRPPLLPRHVRAPFLVPRAWAVRILAVVRMGLHRGPFRAASTRRSTTALSVRDSACALDAIHFFASCET